jgi:hypothetical protein
MHDPLILSQLGARKETRSVNIAEINLKILNQASRGDLDWARESNVVLAGIDTFYTGCLVPLNAKQCLYEHNKVLIYPLRSILLSFLAVMIYKLSA